METKPISIKNLWKELSLAIKADERLQSYLNKFVRKDRIFIIDHLNQVGQIPQALRYFEDKIGVNVERADEYILSTSLHSIGCHRGECRGEVGIQKIRFQDPISFETKVVTRKQKVNLFKLIAAQVPKVKFIDVKRSKFRKSQKLYTFQKSRKNIATITTNGNYSKEIDDMMTVLLFLELTKNRKQAFIQSCDKYKWMPSVLKRKDINNVKQKQFMPYFLSKEIMGTTPALILMGYECSYDCSLRQKVPHDTQCKLKKEKEPKPIYV